LGGEVFVFDGGCGEVEDVVGGGRDVVFGWVEGLGGVV
jgi:hypothetical protein